MPAPPDYTDLYQGAGKLWNVDPLLLRSMAQIESSGGTDLSTSSAGAKGVMQFTPETAARYQVDVNDPKSSIYGAARYMDDLLRDNGGDLNAALSAYGGDKSGKGYAKSVLGVYGQLQAQQRAPAVDTDPNSPTRGQPTYRNVNPPPSAPDVDTTAKGNPGQPAPGVPTTAAANAPPPGAVTGGASFTMDTPATSNEPPADFRGALFGKPAPAPAPAATPAEPNEQGAPSGDFRGRLFGPPPTAPAAAAPAPATPAPATPPPATPSSAPAPSPGAADATPPKASDAPDGNLTPPPQPSWWEQNVAAPVRQAYNPLTSDAPAMNYLFGQPALQDALAGAVQGIRDPAQTLSQWGAAADQRYPWLADIDRRLGQDPAARAERLAAETAAYNREYGDSLTAGGARLGTNLLATYPVTAGIGALARGGQALLSAGEALPYVGPAVGAVARALPFGGIAGEGGAQNVLTSPDKDAGTAFSEGATGALAVGGVLSSLGRGFLPTTPGSAEQMAERLGIRLSTGQRQGGVAQRIEDTTAPIPGSGAAPFAQQQRGDITRVIAREAGIPGDVSQIDTVGLNAARRAAGQRIENAASQIDVPSNTSLGPDLRRIINNATQAGNTTQQAQTAANLSRQLINLIQNNNGVLPGPEFARFIARGGPLDTAINSSVPEVRDVGIATREALYNAAQTGGAGSQAALADLARGRYQYKVIRAVEPAITRTPGGTEEMSLLGLAQRIRNEFDMTRTGPGADMQDLSRVIAGPLRALPSSGTAERSLWQKLLGLTPEAAMGGTAFMMAPTAADQALGAVGPFGVAGLLGRASRYGPGMGWVDPEAARFNPLLPRIAGPAVATNPLLTNQGQP